MSRDSGIGAPCRQADALELRSVFTHNNKKAKASNAGVQNDVAHEHEEHKLRNMVDTALSVLFFTRYDRKAYTYSTFEVEGHIYQ